MSVQSTYRCWNCFGFLMKDKNGLIFTDAFDQIGNVVKIHKGCKEKIRKPVTARPDDDPYSDGWR